jgi:hypothetical protein
MEAQPEPEVDTTPESATESLRQRLARRGRLQRYEEDLARRRRERWRNPQLEIDDTYRARQRLAAQKVFNQFFGVYDPPVILTGEHHHNPSVSVRGGRMGAMIDLAPRPLARDEDDRFVIVDTDAEIKKNIPELNVD